MDLKRKNEFKSIFLVILESALKKRAKVGIWAIHTTFARFFPKLFPKLYFLNSFLFFVFI
jgi:hypothetical protein